MKEKKIKYAKLLIEKCVNLQKNEPLYIEAPVETYEFVEMIYEIASKITNDIHVTFNDAKIRHDALMTLSIDEIKEHPFWNKKIYDEYAEKNSAFLFLEAPNPDIMEDVPKDKVSIASLTSRISRPLYNKKQMTYEVAWCIAGVPTKAWAKKVYGKEDVDALWEQLFDLCCINGDITWDDNIKASDDKNEILNSYGLKELHYTNSLGTNLHIGLDENAIWCGAKTLHDTGKEIIVNMPTYENFTSPDRNSVNGVVYASKPLVYGGVLIENFGFRFKDGKVIEIIADKNKEILENLVNTDEGSCMLGECALVDYNSPISLSNKVYYTTLFDENASCHIALGEGFKECTKDGYEISDEELVSRGVNMSKIHVDFMIGTKDLNITGIDKNGNEVEVFKNGNFVLHK